MQNNITDNTIRELEDKIDYKFNDPSLLKNAITHSSYSAENGKSYKTNNERLEFIGDAYLDAIIGAKLFEILKEDHEGILSKDRAAIVCEDSLAMIASRLCLGKYLLLGKGEDSNGGREKESILADAVEAIIGAVIVDGSYEDGKRMVLELFEDNIRLAIQGKLFKDYKSILQEKIQEKYHDVKIVYDVIDSSGPDHNKVFTVEVLASHHKLGEGKGKSKKEAEQEAAKSVIMKGEI